jgi:hypothetical protein
MMNQLKRENTFYDNLFGIILLIAVCSSLVLGNYFKKFKISETVEKRNESVVKTHFILNEPPLPVEKKLPAVKKQPPEKQVVVEKKEDPIDLSEKPLINQQVDDVQKPVENKPVVRRVYGLRKVFSTGLGSGGELADAVIGKLGNTLATDVDTITATRDDIKGQIVSTTTVTSAPKYIKMVKPEYTKEMVDSKTEGIVKVKVLVDIDGKVKKATVISDIGLNSGYQAVKATLKMEFTPAMRGSEAVAVWIVIPIRFVMLS